MRTRTIRVVLVALIFAFLKPAIPVESAANYTLIELGSLGGNFNEAIAVDDHGQVVGNSETVGGGLHAFFWENGVMTDLGNFGGEGSQASLINEHGQVIGVFFDPAGENHVFFWEAGVMTQVDTTGRFQYCGPMDINDLGQVVGNTTKAYGPTESFVWQNGDITVLVHGTLHDINNLGSAAAGYVTRGKTQTVAALWLIK